MSVYQYRIFCNTEGTNVVGYGASSPTVCYNNNAHSVDLSSVTLLEEISNNIVQVQQESTATGGHYGCKTKSINVSAGPDVDSEIAFDFDVPVSLLSTSMVTTSDHEDDILNCYIGTDTSVGTLSGNISIGANVVDVDSSVMNFAQLGYMVKLDDGTNADDIGIITGIDSNNNQITVNGVTANSFLSATPTIVKLTTHMIDTFEIGPPWQYNIGHDKIGGSYLPANTEIKVVYTNKSASAKKIKIQINYLY